MTIVPLFEAFIQERRYNMGVSAKTLTLYQQVFRTCQHALPTTLEELTPQAAKLLTVWLATTPTPQGPRSPHGINAYLRVWNAFFKWLTTEHGHPTIRLQMVKTPKRVMPTYSDAHIQTIMQYKPTCNNDLRVKALWVLAIDTGCRITELLTLTRANLNLDTCTIQVIGKGNKERVVPFGQESRKVLWGWVKTHSHAMVFATRTGQPISARNAARDLTTLLDRLRLPKPKRLWHSTRRTFGTTYIRNGGDVFRLQQTLGHSNLETTRRYVEIDLDSLRSVHSTLSPLAVVKR
jgi:integrase/recombinase XerD